ncbi:hypothetical protein CAter282_4605 [Collimonas arenae]|uniref:Uncharacterized protein n=1 Tax=Collimonas arenae TaxID=279058 RepID=A0A127QQ45_9BURK|nr:hypothetical protein CAter282_4605 [Collimonas arenae]
MIHEKLPPILIKKFFHSSAARGAQATGLPGGSGFALTRLLSLSVDDRRQRK